MKICNTTSRAKIQCVRVVSGEGGSGPDVYILGQNKTYVQWLLVNYFIKIMGPFH